MHHQDLLDRWKSEPFPLLPLLHAIHEREGHLSEAALRSVSETLRIPLAELCGTVSFYHHLSPTPGGQCAPRVCTGPICALRGADELLSSLGPLGATGMPCAGRCDDPIPVLMGRKTEVGLRKDRLAPKPSPLPPEPPAGTRECVFASIRSPGRSTMAGYRATGGGLGLDRAVQGGPQHILDELEASGLAGRGGAGFPTARKWRAVRAAEGTPKSIVCNADEGEPGCFKDRALMDYDPLALIEGMVIAGVATGATRGVIYLRYEYPETAAILERALVDARQAGWIGADAAGSGQPFDILLRVGAGAYICGEETSLLESLEGRHPFPRNRPPFPVTHGLEGLPTAVNNVETLASVPPILTQGGAWYRSLGRTGHAGTKVVSLSGDILHPGNYEVPIGLPLQELLHDWAGGPSRGLPIQAVTMAGLSGGFLGGQGLAATLDEPCLRGLGSFLGAGGIMVFDAGRDLVQIARAAMEFFAHESCGKCFPCRIGTKRLSERLADDHGLSRAAWHDETSALTQTMKATSACGLGQAAPLIVESLAKWFPSALARHLEVR